MSELPNDPNPYAAPEAELTSEPLSSDSLEIQEAEAIRRKYLNHEASIRSIGSLYYLAAGVFMLVAGFGLLNVWNRGFASVEMITFGLCAVFLAVFILLGRGLRRLQTWARWVAVALSAFPFVTTMFTIAIVIASGLPGAGVGQVLGLSVFQLAIPGYILYLLLSSKSKFIFTPEYRKIIAMTPHVKYKSSCLLLLGLIILVVVVLMTVVGVMSG